MDDGYRGIGWDKGMGGIDEVSQADGVDGWEAGPWLASSLATVAELIACILHSIHKRLHANMQVWRVSYEWSQYEVWGADREAAAEGQLDLLDGRHPGVLFHPSPPPFPPFDTMHTLFRKDGIGKRGCTRVGGHVQVVRAGGVRGESWLDELSFLHQCPSHPRRWALCSRAQCKH
eukprot:365390-Chlamydomonas_euryale.AAC.27